MNHSQTSGNYVMLSARWSTGRNVLMLAALISIVACIAGYVQDPDRFFSDNGPGGNGDGPSNTTPIPTSNGSVPAPPSIVLMIGGVGLLPSPNFRQRIRARQSLAPPNLIPPSAFRTPHSYDIPLYKARGRRDGPLATKGGTQ